MLSENPGYLHYGQSASECSHFFKSNFVGENNPFITPSSFMYNGCCGSNVYDAMNVFSTHQFTMSNRTLNPNLYEARHRGYICTSDGDITWHQRPANRRRTHSVSRILSVFTNIWVCRCQFLIDRHLEKPSELVIYILHVAFI